MTRSVNLDSLRGYLADPRTDGIGYPDLHRHILTLAERGRLMVAGEYQKVGETVETQRRSDVEMNQPVRV